MSAKNMKDLGLSYENAMHGVQTLIAYEMAKGSNSTEPKHLRVGIDSSHVTDLAVANLLIDKGVFTEEEYIEAVRLAANNELAMRSEQYPNITFR